MNIKVKKRWKANPKNRIWLFIQRLIPKKLRRHNLKGIGLLIMVEPWLFNPGYKAIPVHDSVKRHRISTIIDYIEKTDCLLIRVPHPIKQIQSSRQYYKQYAIYDIQKSKLYALNFVDYNMELKVDTSYPYYLTGRKFARIDRQRTHLFAHDNYLSGYITPAINNILENARKLGINSGTELSIISPDFKKERTKII